MYANIGSLIFHKLNIPDTLISGVVFKFKSSFGFLLNTNSQGL